MNSEIPGVVLDASYELVIRRSSAVKVMNLKVTLEIRQLLAPFQVYYGPAIHYTVNRQAITCTSDSFYSFPFKL